jgi:hypothetical protein
MNKRDMMNRITEQRIIPHSHNTEELLTLTLQPQTIDLSTSIRDRFRNRIDNDPNHSLPFVKRIDETECIDKDTIIEINNTTSSERRMEIMESLLEQNNNSEVRTLLISNSSLSVRTYLNDILIGASSHGNITEDHLLRVGNLFLYTISNLTGIETVHDVLVPLRQDMFNYNMNTVFSILTRESELHNQVVDQIALRDEEALTSQAEEHKKVIKEQYSFLNRRNIIIAGTTFGISTIAAYTFGIPNIASAPVIRSILNRSIPTSSTALIPSSFGGDSIRLRDVWDEALKKMHEFLKGCL